MDNEIIKKLIEEALTVRNNSYCPYSKFSVGAALLSAGKIYTGCNIENASYSATVCAERTAFFKAVAEGVKTFDAICIMGGSAGKLPDALISPCGVCRQVMAEFCDDDFKIILAKSTLEYEIYTLKEFFPEKFILKNKPTIF